MDQSELLEGQQLQDWARQRGANPSVGRGRLAEVAPGLFLGNKDAASDFELLKRVGIKAVVNVGAGPNAFEDTLKYHKIHVQDKAGASLHPHFGAACDFIQSALGQGAVLVHCQGGISRSPTVIAAFLVAHRRLTIPQALDVVRKSRKCANPRAEFLLDLQHFVQDMQAAEAADVVFDNSELMDLARRGSRAINANSSGSDSLAKAQGTLSSASVIADAEPASNVGLDEHYSVSNSETSSRFAKYDKMGEDSGPCGVEAGRKLQNRYVVTEKIHGANFCLIASRVTGTKRIEVHFANRTHVLGSAENAEDFFGCRSSGLLHSLKPLATRVLQTMDSEVAAVHIYGELFGGQYPHPQVEQQLSQPVQCGVWYAPGLHFQAFDVATDVAGNRRFLSFAIAREACETCGLPFAAPLLEGTLSECLEYPVEFETTIPSRLGIPQIAAANDGTQNLAEGVVIRPLHEPPQGAIAKGCGKVSSRGLFKRKIPAFSEKKYQNNGWREGKAGGTWKSASADMKEDLVRYEMEACVTEQRLNNVLSKTGRVDPKNKAACCKLLEDLKQDVFEAVDTHDYDALRNSHTLQQELDQLCRKLITRVLLRKAASTNNAL
eukprot:gnl/MRDRNA2_/MRDRNA2_111019_c0_seq1.p1 gnl/MRDRNA2_/MRDRNA2_111019_c0~~gnl/MRDRNA2_/MRDRNA2_111019_c0_seq1.p1  ORF type:complete len:606 (-),score=118.99 gnl/MRDRNA2_/MRDRNA2_111019_c0_seq1:150-1967(-)